VANGTGKPASLSVSVHDPESGATHSTGHLELHASRDWSEWHDVPVSLMLAKGTNFITSYGAGDVGGLNLDSVTIST
jgi:hypothetical protein